MGRAAQAPFVKIGAVDILPRFAAEAEGLAILRKAGSVRVPNFVSCAATNGQARLEIEFLDLHNLDRDSGAVLGRQLADLHRHIGAHFGFAEDNWIGGSPQFNGWCNEWPQFFADRRLRPQLKWAVGKGMDSKVAEQGESLADRLAAFFVDHHPQPSLLHGDLWGGNASALPDGTPVIFDPAVYYGDRETDVAMSELFGGFPESFYVAYRKAWPLDSGYETRKTLYNLYHVINHFNLFGAAYLGQVQRMIGRLLAELRG
jgi:protein-ribulosamine 3-kinase